MRLEPEFKLITRYKNFVEKNKYYFLKQYNNTLVYCNFCFIFIVELPSENVLGTYRI